MSAPTVTREWVHVGNGWEIVSEAHRVSCRAGDSPTRNDEITARGGWLLVRTVKGTTVAVFADDVATGEYPPKAAPRRIDPVRPGTSRWWIALGYIVWVVIPATTGAGLLAAGWALGKWLAS